MSFGKKGRILSGSFIIDLRKPGYKLANLTWENGVGWHES